MTLLVINIAKCIDLAYNNMVKKVIDYMENLKLNKFKEEIKNKKVAVLGIGKSNIPAIKYLNKLGANIIAHDKKETLGDECKDILNLNNVEFKLGENSFKGLNDVDYIIRSPGVKPFTKEIEEAVKSGVKLTSEIELLVELAPCKIIGVTGSAGKTTTTTIISEFLKRAGYKVWLGGNIGIPLFANLDDMKENDIIVLELSSFQLMTMKKSPDISVITNIYEDHLDYHRSFNEYVEAKSNIFMHHNNDTKSVCVFNLDDNYTNSYINKLNNTSFKGEIRSFSKDKIIENGAKLDRNRISLNFKNIKDEIDVSDIKIKGEKNHLNICAAICAIIDFVSIEDIVKTLKEFKGVEHRIEYVDTKNGVEYYNDSISTTPGKAMAALTSFDKKIIMIAGGYDKNLNYTDFGKVLVNKVKCLVLLGDTKEKIKTSVINSSNYDKDNIKIVEVSSMEKAVEVAQKNANSGDIVVMSPASASFDMYKSYKDRGKHFKEIVGNLV